MPEQKTLREILMKELSIPAAPFGWTVDTPSAGLLRTEEAILSWAKAYGEQVRQACLGECTIHNVGDEVGSIERLKLPEPR